MTLPVSDLEKLKVICRGHGAAIQFCETLLRWCHWIDDVIDRDRPWDPDATVRVNLEAIVVFSSNEFFQRHKFTLFPLIMQAARAHGDSVQWEKREAARDRRAADVLKSLYHEVIFHAGYLTAAEDGADAWGHLAEVTKLFREYNYDCKD